MDRRLLLRVTAIPALPSVIGIYTSNNMQNGDEAFQKEATDAVRDIGWTGQQIHTFGAPLVGHFSLFRACKSLQWPPPERLLHRSCTFPFCADNLERVDVALQDAKE